MYAFAGLNINDTLYVMWRIGHWRASVPDYKSGFKRSGVARGVGMVVLYGLILLTILVVGLLVDSEEETASVFGSLEGRFTSDVSMELQGKTVHYRENEITNYLIIGIDQQQLSVKDYQLGGQADFLLVLSADRKNRTITPMMIDRDTMTQVPTYGVFGNPAGSQTMQICLAQAFSGSGVSGSQNTVKSVESLLEGVKISRFVLMDLGAINLLNDALGGVPVTVQDDLTVLDPALRKGETVLLQGGLAEYFVRGRTLVADGTNISRMNRQHTYLKALLNTMQKRISEDGHFLEKVFSRLSGHMYSDTPESILISDANAYARYNWQEMQMLPGTHTLGEDGFAEFWPDEPAKMQLIADIWFSK